VRPRTLLVSYRPWSRKPVPVRPAGHHELRKDHADIPGRLPDSLLAAWPNDLPDRDHARRDGRTRPGPIHGSGSDLDRRTPTVRGRGERKEV